MMDEQQEAIRAKGIIEGCKSDIRSLVASLDAVPMWRQSAVLTAQCEEILGIIDDMESRFERKLVVTLLGPCGSGKSTLLNALAGVDDLSDAGYDRPTTRDIKVLCRNKEDARQLVEQMGGDTVEIRASHASSRLEHVLLIDTPDTDSNEQKRHIPLVNQAIGLSDVLICLFDSENPKRRDYVDFLKPYVQRFDGKSLVCVLNKCDRQDEQELKTNILPQFMDYIRDAWQYENLRVLCVSARSHLNNPAWDPKARPRHDFDQFHELEEIIFGQFSEPGYVIDRRVENTRALRDMILARVGEEIEKDRPHLQIARELIHETEQTAVDAAASGLKTDDPQRLFGVNVLLYQKLAHRWIGPMGWLIAIWARLLIFGTGVAAMFKFGSPIYQVAGMVSSLRRFKQSRAAVAEVGNVQRIDSALRHYRLHMMRQWPEISKHLIHGRFNESDVRNIEDRFQTGDQLGNELSNLWNDAMDNAVEKASRTMSGFGFQFLFNIPVIGLLGYAGWITVSTFFTGNYLNSHFFLHAFLAMGIVLFLLFFIYQTIVRLFAGSDRIVGNAFHTLREQTGLIGPVALEPVLKQLDILLSLPIPSGLPQ